MKKFLPPNLKENATVGFLAVSGDIQDIDPILKVKKDFEILGYNVKLPDTLTKNKNYLCAEDSLRAKSLNKFFEDSEIDAIICIRGGYGSIRILDKIDYNVIKENPKIFCGYSDITALQLMIYKKTGLITYNAPMVLSDFANEISTYTQNSFFNTLKQNISEIIIDNPSVYFEGIANGILWGGNLSTVQSLCGQDFIPDEKFIFLAEDINEPVYKIDKMFTQLLNIKQFKNNLSGIVLGNFTNVNNHKYFDDFFFELAQELKIPTIKGLKFGHEKDKQTFPIGVNAILDTNLSKILIK